MCADITAFDPETVIDIATYGEPHRFPVGIEYVMVNGVAAIESGDYTGAHAGKTLRKR
jgi:N-acyl-D-amino-acid deacylase